MKNPYDVLGLNKSATETEIKKAYRALAMKHHPDKGGDEELFREIVNAYETLSDPKKKSHYDSYTAYRQGYDADDQFFEEFLKAQGFSDMFNNRYGWSQNGKGNNIKSELYLNLNEAYFGTKKEIRLGLKTVSVSIKPGIKNGQKLRLKGLGQKGLTDDLNGDLILSVFIQNDSEYLLDDRGLHKIHTIDIFDAVLGGKSIIQIFDKKISFTVPKGTQNGTILRISGKGYPIYDSDGKYGDLYIKITIDIPNDLTDKEILLITNLKESIDERRRQRI